MFGQQLETEKEIRLRIKKSLSSICSTRKGLCTSNEDKEDTTQQCLIKIYRLNYTINKVEWPSFVYTVTRNTLFDNYRKQRMTTLSLDEDIYEIYHNYTQIPVIDTLASWDIIDSVIPKIFSPKTVELVRTILALRREGYSLDEIDQKVDNREIAVQNFRNYYYKAVQRIKTYMSECYMA